MGSSKRGGGADEIYATHLFGAGSRFYKPGGIAENALRLDLETVLTDMAINRFRWDNLPDTMDARFMESMLVLTGLSVVYFDEKYDALLAVRGSGAGYVNMVDNPVSFSVIGPGGSTKPVLESDPAVFYNKTISAYQPMVHKKLDDKEKRRKCVPIWNNYTRTPDIQMIRIYANRLAIIDRTLEINTKNARRNKVIKGSPNTNLSMVNFSRQMDDGEELLQVTGPMEDMAFIEALDLGILPDSYEKLGVHRTRVWNELMIRLGIDSANQEKKERMVASEVSANDAQADTIRFKSLKARREAAKHINEIFGENIEVNYETEIEQEEKQEKLAELTAPPAPDDEPDKIDGRSEKKDEK